MGGLSSVGVVFMRGEIAGNMKVQTKESFEEFKRLKKWVQKCPIEAAMEIEELRAENKRLKQVMHEVKDAVANDVFAVLSNATFGKG